MHTKAALELPSACCRTKAAESRMTRTIRSSQTRRASRPTTKPNYMRMLLSLTHRVDQGSTWAAICLLQIKGGGILNDAHHMQLSNSKDNSPNYQIKLHAHATQLDTSCGPRQHLSCCLLVAEQEQRLCACRRTVRCSQTRRTVRPIIKPRICACYSA